MPPSLSNAPKTMTELTASFVDIQDRPADAAAAAPATIDGHNLFTGDLPRGIMNGILRITNNMEWEQTWRVNLKREPPAALPDGAEAQVFLSGSKDAPVYVTPQNLRYEGNQLHIEWQRAHMGRDDLPDDAQVPSRFAVLLTPKVTCNHSFIDIDGHAREKWMQALEAEIRIITEGIPRDVPLLPVLKITPRHISR